MTPGTIGSLCATADALESSCSITAFLLRWTAFEGLRVRILTVVARMRGCSLAPAHELVDARRISGLAGFASTLSDWTVMHVGIGRRRSWMPWPTMNSEPLLNH